jgi:1-acyl-sn-glycerol-3-phosphate acyltransferase
MQTIVIDKPYVPVPPHRWRVWPKVLGFYLPRLLRKKYGVMQVDCVHADRLRESIASGNGVLLTPNHCRDEDPLVLGRLSAAAGSPFFIMASWHLFMKDRMTTFLLRRAGAFSIYREGIDRTAVNTAIDILESAERPLVVFPEGYIARTNDVVHELLDGVSLMARTAAKRRAKKDPAAKVLVHPVAIRYRFQGDINAAADKVLDSIEKRLTWSKQNLPLEQRIHKVGSAVLALKELEYLGQADNGDVATRLAKLTNSILAPLEKEWLKEQHDDAVPTRVKRLRSAILPDMTKGELGEAESQRRWKQLADLYLAQQLDHYPPNYLTTSPDRILETIERLEEDLTDNITVHGEIHATVKVGEAIEVTGERERGTADALLVQIREQLETMLEIKGTLRE